MVLELIRSSLPTLVMDHPKPGVAYKYFTFISDRQKGLNEILQDVFPDNHVCFCAVHIARNVERSFGKNVAEYVFPLAKTFSPMLSGELMTKITAAGREYLEGIPPSQWRNTAWLADPTLPQRYGIRTSNMSESSNSMFEKSRDGSWLFTVDTILSKIVLRIASLREAHKGKIGVVDKVASKIRNRWENCIGFEVVNLLESGRQFTVFRNGMSSSENSVSHTIDVVDYTCDCGEWQDQGVPCIHAVAYFRLHRNLLLQQILDEHVDKHHTYEHEAQLFQNNVIPVCMERISPDGITLPPRPSTKRSTGRPKKLRMRKRSRWAHEPEKSNIKCSKCHERGHNVRTCSARQALATHELDLS